MTANSILPLLLALTVSPLCAQEKEAKEPKKEPPPSLGVLKPKDPTGEPLPLKFTDQAARAAMIKLYKIHQALFAYAQENDQVFPVGKSSNEAFRQLLAKALMVDERLFHLEKEGDKNDRPDGDIGTADDGYKAALVPGECSFYYITGLTSDRDDPTLPIAYTKATGEDGVIYVIVVRIGGYSKVYKTTDGIVKDEKDGKMVDILSEEYGTNPANIVAPLAKEQEKTKAK